MNAIKDSCPPSLPAPVTDSPEGPIIGVRLLMPEGVAALSCYPGLTHGAAEILARLLRAKIEAAGCPVLAASTLLPFHRSFYMFDLGSKDRKTALEALQTELAALRLLDWAQIAWDDAREGIWRLHHPKSGEFSMPPEDERAADMARVAGALEAVKRLLRQHGAGQC